MKKRLPIKAIILVAAISLSIGGFLAVGDNQVAHAGLSKFFKKILAPLIPPGAPNPFPGKGGCPSNGFGGCIWDPPPGAPDPNRDGCLADGTGGCADDPDDDYTCTSPPGGGKWPGCDRKGPPPGGTGGTAGGTTQVPFGGKIQSNFTCDCSCGDILIEVGPPKGGSFLYSPCISQLYEYYQIYSTNVWVLGYASPGGTCWYYAGITCSSKNAKDGTIQKVGTSLE